MLFLYVIAWLFTGWIGAMLVQIVLIKGFRLGEFQIGDVKAAVPMAIAGPVILLFIPIGMLLIGGGKYLDWAMQDHRPVFRRHK